MDQTERAMIALVKKYVLDPMLVLLPKMMELLEMEYDDSNDGEVV